MSTELVEMVWSNFPEGGSKLAVLMAIAEAASPAGNCGVRWPGLPGPLAYPSRQHSSP